MMIMTMTMMRFRMRLRKDVYASVFGICGSLVVLWRLWMVLGPSSLTEVLTLAEPAPAIVFSFEEFRELEEFGVCSVPDGLSATS